MMGLSDASVRATLAKAMVYMQTAEAKMMMGRMRCGGVVSALL